MQDIARNSGSSKSAFEILEASAANILSLLSKDFFKLVISGFLIAVPISVYLVRQWLTNFARQIYIGFGIFFFVGVVAIAVAIIAVGYQSIQTALVNPVDSLRSE